MAQNLAKIKQTNKIAKRSDEPSIDNPSSTKYKAIMIGKCRRLDIVHWPQNPENSVWKENF